MSLLDQLASKGCEGTRIVAIDPTESRRAKIAKMVHKLGGVPGNGIFKVAAIEEARNIVTDWTGNLGCNAALEVRNSFLTL